MNDLIMIVEDDPYISHFLQMSFEQEGYRILMTTKGHEALSLFYSHQRYRYFRFRFTRY